MSQGPLLPDLDLVRRCQAIVGGYTAARLETIAARPGNPRGAAVRRYGDAVATRAPPFGEGPFNRGFGFTDETLDAAAEVVDWYAEANVPGTFEIVPGLPSGAVMAMLQARGYRHTGFHAAFAGPADLPQQPSPGVEVRRLTDETDLEAFSGAYHRGWNSTQSRFPKKPWLTEPGWSLYLGLCDGEPAGAAVLSLANGDAYLADSAVDPKWRRRGVQRALLDRRCADAAAAGAEVVFSGADYLSVSSHNMLRKGLALLFTRAIWTTDAPA